MGQTFARTLTAGAIGGLVAGLILGFLLLGFARPLITASEKFEKHEANQGQQRQAGTLIGAVLLGTVYGLAVSAAHAGLARRSKRGWLTLGLLVGGGGFLLINLIPALVLPPNPPGVEATASIAVRQFRWLAVLGAEAAGLLAAYLAFNFSRRRLPGWSRVILATVAFLVPVAAVFILGPPDALKPTGVPASVIADFRLTSVAIFLVFWLVLGMLVARLDAALADA